MINKVSRNLSNIYKSNHLPWIIIVIGIVLRLIRYLQEPSLWFDEAVYAVNFIDRSIPELFHPSPDYDQSSPYGFIVLVKLSIQALGNSEMAFKLFPFLSGIISLFLFYNVSKHLIGPRALPVALALFAILDPLVLFSSELKTYSSDIAFALIIYSLTVYVRSNKLDVKRLLLFAVFGVIVVWFSNPSVFILAGVGASLLLSSFKKKEWPQVWRFAVIISVWALSFITVYYFYTRHAYANIGIGAERILKMEGAYMPFPPMSFGDIKWFIDVFFKTFDFPVGIAVPGIAALAFIIGCATMYSEDRDKFFLVISPVVFTLLATAMHKYPFKGRLILFLVPFFLLFIAKGIEEVWNKTKNNSALIWISFAGILLLYPLMWSSYHVIKPPSREEIKPVLSYIKDNWQEGDTLYVHFYAQYAFEYYSRYYPTPYSFNEDDYIVGIAPRQWYKRWKRKDVADYYDDDVPIEQPRIDILKEYMKDLDKLVGNKRVWVLFTGDIPGQGMKEEKFFTYYLDTLGKRLDFFGQSGIGSTYLYNMQ